MEVNVAGGWGAKHWAAADSLWGSTKFGGASAACLAEYSSAEAWNCLLAQNALPHVATPLFVLNSDIDMWSVQFILGVKCGGWPPAPWPPTNCSASDVQAVTKWRDEFRQAFVSAVQQANQWNGAFVDSCIVHEQNVDYCSSQGVGNCAGPFARTLNWRTPLI